MDFVHEHPEDDDNDYSTDSDSGRESSGDEEEPIVTSYAVSAEGLLKSILKDISEGVEGLSNKEHYQNLIRDGISAGRLTELAADYTNRTVLHDLASRKDDIPELSKLRGLLEFLVQHPNNLLAEKNQSGGHTPLHIAIIEGKEDFVKLICGAHPNIDSILSIPDHLGKNCLHVGVEQEVEFLDYLVGIAGAQTLSAKDSRGNTPLHLAVEYGHCKPNQLRVVKAIIAKCDDVVRFSEESYESSDPRALTYNNNHLSPYLYHITTREAAEVERRRRREAKRAKAEKNIIERKKTSGSSRKDGRTKNRVAPPDARSVPSDPSQEAPRDPRNKPTISANLDFNEEFGRDSYDMRDNAMQATDPLPSSIQGHQFNVNNSAQVHNTKSSNNDLFTKLELKKRNSGLKSSSKEITDTRQLKPTKESAEEIRLFLKYHYLRNRGHDSAIEIIYDRKSSLDKQIYFDLSGYTTMTRRRLMTALKHIRFDDILQHVEVPHIIIEGNDSLPNTPKLRDYSAKTDLGGNGRADLVFIFRWLRSKGVQTIIQVIVDDLGSTAHGDESIEKALSGFGVEIWNWKKRDLCSEVIINTAPNVQVVYLYWSGNNAVLRGWCDEGGLKKLKELRKIHIHGQQGFDSYSRTESNLEYFKSRMIATNPNIEITWDGLQAVREPQAAKAALPQLPRQPAQDHWIKCMTEFRRFLFQAEANFNKSQNMAVEDMIDQPVKVALIDDGININELEYYPVGGRSFCPRTEDKAFNYPYYVSSSGHGTVMASLIYRICPRAQLYVLKLADHLGRDGSRQITAKSAARAISEAVRMQVHVISMSWTIDPPKDEKTRNELESAIGEAVKKKILLFCSASDGGAKEDHSYPWIAARDRIFRIGGAHASGRTDDEVGSTSQINFTFPGNDVILEGVGSNHEVKYRTGSSVATALAAGLAALILYCVQIRILRASKEDVEVYKSYFRQLTDHDQMVKVFRRSIGVTEESNYKYIAVWDTFEKPIKLSKEKDPERWIDLIARVGEELCMKISTS